LLVAWAPDGKRLAFLSLEGPELSGDPIMPAPGRHRRLWTVRPGSDSPEPVTPSNVTVWEFAWSPKSDQLAVFFSAGPDETDYYRGQIGMVSATGGAITQRTRLDRQAAALTWSPDGSRIAYVSGEWSDRGLVGGDVFTLAAQGGEPRNLTEGIMCSPSLVRWQADGKRLLYAAWDGVGHQVGWLDEATGTATALARDLVIGEPAWPKVSASATMDAIAVTRTIAGEHSLELYLGTLRADGISWRRLTHLNAALEESTAVSPTRVLHFTGADGWDVEALYNPPVKPPASGTPPLVLNVHGGPSSAWVNNWSGGFLTQLLCGAGFGVLRVNSRGSMGRGVAFADAVLGDMGGKDLEDLLAGVDEAVRLGLADPERVGIAGWSYGGFMAAWAVSQVTRFKAAVMGAGICDYLSFHAQTNIPDWDMRFLKATPTEDPATYREKSALSYATRIQTPTLILHGEQDACVPVNQAYAFARALTERGVPVELVIYPREGHGPQEKAHIEDMESRIVRWLSRYLKSEG
ncbi:MAG TPA: S9 family peptidase, partial [Ktedonobacterales bacterium]